MAIKQTISSLTIENANIEILDFKKESMGKEDGENISWQSVSFIYGGDVLKGTTSNDSKLVKGKTLAGLEVVHGKFGLKFKVHLPTPRAI